MSDIDQILYPTVLTSLREDVPPVQCIVWKGGEEYESITFDKVYPFDTIDDIKRLICAHYENDPAFIPRFTFVGVPLGEAAYSDAQPTRDSVYIPLDWLWFPTETNDPTKTYILNSPRKALTEPDMRFVSSDGSYASPNYEPRGRSTIEEVFSNPRTGFFQVKRSCRIPMTFITGNSMPSSKYRFTKFRLFSLCFTKNLILRPNSISSSMASYGPSTLTYG